MSNEMSSSEWQPLFFDADLIKPPSGEDVLCYMLGSRGPIKGEYLYAIDCYSSDFDNFLTHVLENGKVLKWTFLPKQQNTKEDL
jgi:hypothetical protein